MKKIYVVGIGPGGHDEMSIRADKIIESSDIIVGYNVYVELIKPYYPNKEYFTTAMKQEIDRCRKAFDFAMEDKRVAVVCSGDSGVYGMAGLVYELSEEYPEVEIEVVPGITAALSGASVLGAPLTHDFAVISLSDLLTPREVIEKRLRCAAESDMCVAIYNPSSKKRSDYLKWACGIMLEYKANDTVVGYVRNIGRDGEEFNVMTLSELANESVDMFTTVFVGNKDTKNINGKMVTPRGYIV